MHDAIQEDLAAVWERVREELRASVSDSTFRLWLEPLRFASTRGSTLYLSAPGTVRAWVERRYARRISAVLESQASVLRQVRFLSGEETPPEPQDADAGPPMPGSTHTFERFVIGHGNRLAHAAALAVAESPAEAYNPLYLHGEPGLGKTHLLGAIGNYLCARRPDLTVRFTTAERFTNEFIMAIRASGAEAFKRRHRDLDVLLIDDVQFLEGKERTEEEFFHTFNALFEAGSQIVLSGDRSPADLSSLAVRLRDRFEWGLTARLSRPDPHTRAAVLTRLASEQGVEVSDEGVIRTIVSLSHSNIRTLEGALTRVLAFASLMDEPVSTALVDRVLSPTGTPRVAQTLPPNEAVEQISHAVAERYSICADDLSGPGRASSLVRARQVAMYFARRNTTLSLPAIGRAFGGRDHSTVIHAVRRVENQLATDHELSAAVDAISAKLAHSTIAAPS